MRLIAALILLLTVHGPVFGQNLDDLAFMEGQWTGIRDSVISEEYLTSPAGGLITGMHKDLDLRTGKVFFEFMQIAETDSGLFYMVRPMGREQVLFKVIHLEEKKVIFENPDNDFPQRIWYELRNDTMMVGISDLEVTNVRSWVWTRATRQ